MPSLRELLATFDIDVDESALKQAGEHIEGFKKVLKQAGEIIAETFATEALHEFIESQIQAGAELKVTSERLGTTTDELQAYQLAAGEAGVSADALTTALRFLNRNIEEARVKGGDQAAIFHQLGIALKDDVTGKTRPAGDVMQDLADAIAATEDPAKRTRIAMELLGRQGAQLIPLLSKGGAAFEEARKELDLLGGGMSKEFVESAHEAEAATVRLDFATKGLKSQIAAALFPAFAELVGWFTHLTADLVRFNKETNVLTTGITFFGTIAALKAIGSLKDLIPLVQRLTTSLVLADVTLFGFEIPLLVVIGALGLLYLAFDDVYTLMTGGESVIGDTIDELFGIGTSAQFAKDLGEAFSAFLDILGNVGSVLYNTLLTPLQLVWDTVKGIVGALKEVATGSFGTAWTEMSKAGDEMLNDLQTRGNKIIGGFQGLGEDFTETRDQRRRGRAQRAFGVAAAGGSAEGFQPGGEFFTGPYLPEKEPGAAHHVPTNIYGHPLLPAGGQGTVIHQENNTKVEVHTSSDQPKAVGEAVGAGVATAHQRANDRARTALRQP